MKEIKIIIQARMGSSRLPGKSLMLLHGKPIIQHTIDRCLETGLEVTVATPDTPEDKELHEYLRGVEGIGLYIHQGDENDVARRYLKCANEIGAEHIMRVTADCPFLNVSVLNKLAILYKYGNYNYVSNVIPRTFTKGEDAEIFPRRELLSVLYDGTTHDKEHVTPMIMRMAMRYGRIAGLVNEYDQSDNKMCVDTIEDLNFLNTCKPLIKLE